MSAPSIRELRDQLSEYPTMADEPVLIQDEMGEAEGYVTCVEEANGLWLVFERTDI